VAAGTARRRSPHLQPHSDRPHGAIVLVSVILETLTSIKRAGADTILTCHAVEAAGWAKVTRLPK